MARVSPSWIYQNRARLTLAAEIGSERAIGIGTNVLDRVSIEAASAHVLERFGSIDILVNGAGGNKPEATTSDQVSFFNLPPDAVQWVFNLNFLGTFHPLTGLRAADGQPGQRRDPEYFLDERFPPVDARRGLQRRQSCYQQFYAVVSCAYGPGVFNRISGSMPSRQDSF